uniref:Putative tick 18.3 kDa family protein n=1 Tax=Rhipicephalus pulchellus TaxID=72859 RepID=L7M976_RHIPC
MELVDVISFTVIALAAASLGEAQRNHHRYPSCNEIVSNVAEVESCLYRCRNERGRIVFGNHTDGLTCRFNRWSNKRGRCSRGICKPTWYPGPAGCDDTYTGVGYATDCRFNCTNNHTSRAMPYHHGTPCLTLSDTGKPYDGAGICKNGNCMNGDNLKPREEHEAYPPRLRKCPDKENYSRMVLLSCHYFCNKEGNWFFGYYNSNYSSSCHLSDPPMPGRLGWCCEGKCITEAFCGKGTNSIPEH